jgi:hypothetical protein
MLRSGRASVSPSPLFVGSGVVMPGWFGPSHARHLAGASPLFTDCTFA